MRNLPSLVAAVLGLLSTGRAQTANDWVYTFNGQRLSFHSELSRLVGDTPSAFGKKAIAPDPPAYARFTALNSSPATLQFSGIVAPDLPFLINAHPSDIAGRQVASRETVEFQIGFDPQSLGSFNRSLIINGVVFTLTAVGVPGNRAITMEPVDGNIIQPLQQPSVRLTIDPPPSVPLAGTIELNFTPSSPDRRDLTFIPQGRRNEGFQAVDFTIAAGSHAADFGPGVRLQVGSLAASITLAVTRLVTLNDNTDVLPLLQPASRFSVPQLAPAINARLVSTTSSTFNIVITGYSTTGDMKKVTVQLNPASGATINPTGPVDLDKGDFIVERAFANYFTSRDGVQLGSQFTLTIPAVLKGDLRALQSVTITAVNSVGSTQGTGNFDLK